MRIFALVAIILFAAAAFAAESYTSEYVAGDWLKVTRIATLSGEPLCLDSYGVTDACASPGAIQPNQGTGTSDTTVELLVENVGPTDRAGVDLTEDLSYLPSGARITYSAQPTSSDGRTVTWSLGTLAKGSTLRLSYVVSARIPPETLLALPDIAVAAEPALLSLEAPESLAAGEKATISVQKDGKPIPNAIVVVTYPDGVRHPLRSDLYGTVKFTAAEEGKYTYSIEGYGTEKAVETEVVPPAPAAPVAAAVDTTLSGAIMGVLPVLAALFAIAIIALILYNFFTSRREEEEYAPQQPSAASQPPGSAMAYTQSFSFGAGSAEPEKRIQDRTHDLVESRKRHLAESAAAFAPREEPKEAEATESTATGTDMETIISELEHKARETGEVATEEEEEEVERTISELEAIREKLRAMRTKGRGAEAEESDVDVEEGEAEEEEPEESEQSGEEGDEEEASGTEEASESQEETSEEEEKPAKRAAPKYRPAPRKVIYGKRAEPKVKPVSKKGVKTRFGSRGVKKR